MKIPFIRVYQQFGVHPSGGKQQACGSIHVSKLPEEGEKGKVSPERTGKVLKHRFPGPATAWARQPDSNMRL